VLAIVELFDVFVVFAVDERQAIKFEGLIYYTIITWTKEMQNLHIITTFVEIVTFVKAFEKSSSMAPHSGREPDRVVVQLVPAEKIHSASIAAFVVPKLAETK